VEYKSWPITRA